MSLEVTVDLTEEPVIVRMDGMEAMAITGERILSDGDTRVTSDGEIRVVELADGLDYVTVIDLTEEPVIVVLE